MDEDPRRKQIVELVEKILDQARDRRGHDHVSVVGVSIIQLVVMTCHTCSAVTHIDTDEAEVVRDMLTTRGCIRLN